MTARTWKSSLAAFFTERARSVNAVPTVADLCYVSGRDPRLWQQPEIYADLIGSLITALGADSKSAVLEVGCASGFLAKGVAPGIGRYQGVDLSSAALEVAKRLRLPNASFEVADGSRLPFEPNSFDAAFCYDVITNMPTFDDVRPIVAEMVRVVRPRGRVVVGSIPDAERQSELEERAAQVGRDLESRFGRVLPHAPAPRDGWFARLRRVSRAQSRVVTPQIICYYFRRDMFEELARELGVDLHISEIHARNPYYGLRFNAVLTKKCR